MDSNQKTLQSYQKSFQQYIDDDKSQAVLNSPGNFQGGWLKSLLRGLPKATRILEIGSATGRDVKFIESLGYQVQATDAIDAAVDHLKQQGYDAKKLNILTDSVHSQYDLILASAVFLHFSDDQFEFVLDKLKTVLSPEGILAFSLIQGEGEKTTDYRLGVERYFNYWTESSVRQLLNKKGYEIINVQIGLENKWLLFTTKIDTSKG